MLHIFVLKIGIQSLKLLAFSRTNKNSNSIVQFGVTMNAESEVGDAVRMNTNNLENNNVQTTQRLPVFLYLPNILGYARIAFSFIAMYYAFISPVLTVGLWIIASVFDAIDGILARKLNQCSNFGILVSTRQRMFGDNRVNLF